MSDYIKITDFEAKDSLPSGDGAKIIKGAEFEVEFDAISTAIATKSDLENPTFTGTVTIPTLTLGSTTVTSTGAELNILDGVTSTTAELNILDGVTATTAEINLLDGVTATTAELNVLDGVTATTAELNIMDGVTATTAELNYVDGVTSSIQTQLDGKATSAQGATADSAMQDLSDDITPQLGGNLDVNGNSIVSALNGDIAITPDGSGKIVLDGLNWPTSDGVADYILKTDGAGNLSWVIQASVAAGEIVQDTTPQLGGNLDLNSNDITGTGNINITGSVESDHFKLGTVNTGASGATLTAGEMFISTAATQTVTLPASPSAGDTVYIAVQDFTDTVVARNGENIMSTAEDMTIDTANLTLTFTYINSTIGWRIY